MKKIALILSAAAFVLAAVSCNNAKTTETATDGATASEGPAAGAIVYFNLDRVLEEYDMANDLRSVVETKVGSIQQEINRRGSKLEKDVKSFQDKIDKGLLTRSVAEVQGQKLQEQQNNFQQNTQQGAGRQSSNAVLPPRLGCVIAYLFSMLGCIALYFLGDREDDFVRHHLNQAVVLAILQIVTRILDLDGLLETIVNLFIFFGWIVGMYGSVSGKKTEIPLISQVKIF